jgi:DNA-binding CsgD family transcriptional regulator
MGHGMVLYAEARVALAAHDPAGALDAARAAGCHLAEGFGIDHPGFVPWRDVAALAAHALAETDAARALADDALARARWSGIGRAVSRSLRTVATVGDVSERVERLAEAVALLDDLPARLGRAYALVDLGAALRHDGRRDEARVTLREGLQLADTMGITPLVERATAELRATGVRPRRAAQTGADSLTPAERRVADLAASGHTNAKIAQELFVTPKTVETHLAHVFRKLGIESRKELDRALADRTTDARAG